MYRAPALLAAALVFGLLVAGPARAGETPEREPGPKSTGKVYAWTSRGGLRYEYFIPKDYDPEKGANLTFICHGTGLDRRWGFANHSAGEFRPDDIVVSADGPTEVPNARLYANSPKDLETLHALQEELRAAFRIRQVFLYGHSQGAFWVFLYAGRYKDEVAGALGQAGGIWTETPVGKAFHHQALVLMHGTADPVVPYSNSRGGYGFLVEKGYPLAHLRSLEGWNHWPEQGQAAMELAFLEGMTTDDPARAEASLEFFKKWQNAEAMDPSAFHRVAGRVAAMEEAPESLRKRAAEAAARVEAAAEKHSAGIRADAGKKAGAKFDGKPWCGHLLRFLRDYHGVPAREELAKDWEKTLSAHDAAADKAFREYWRTMRTDAAKAFAAGVTAVRDAFLADATADGAFLDNLEAWRKDAKKWKLDPAAVKAHDLYVPAFREALEKGRKDYLGILRKL